MNSISPTDKVDELDRTNQPRTPEALGLWAFAELVSRAVRAARPHRTTEAPRWVAVKDTFAVGSTRAKDICHHFGLDPYERVPGVKCGACEWEGQQ